MAWPFAVSITFSDADRAVLVGWTHRLARGAFRSTRALEQAIKSYIAATDADP